MEGLHRFSASVKSVLIKMLSIYNMCKRKFILIIFLRKFIFYTVLGSSSRKYVSCPPIALCFKWWYFCPSWILITDKCEKGVWVCCLLTPPNKYLTHWSPDPLFNYWQLLGSQRFLIKWHYQEILLKCKLLAACLNFPLKPTAIN